LLDKDKLKAKHNTSFTGKKITYHSPFYLNREKWINETLQKGWQSWMQTW